MRTMTSGTWTGRMACGLLLCVAVGGCGDVRGEAGSGAGSGYSYAPPQLVHPHPGIAEGRPVLEIEGRGTFYRCPEVSAGGTTPLITDACLTPGDIGHTRYGDYSMLDPSVDCGDGRHATDLGTLGFGFAGQPVIPQRGAAPDRAAVLDCLRPVPRS